MTTMKNVLRVIVISSVGQCVANRTKPGDKMVKVPIRVSADFRLIRYPKSDAKLSDRIGYRI